MIEMEEKKKMPTVAEVMKRVVDVNEIHDVNVSFGTSRQVWAHGEVRVSGYWVCDKVGACVLYTTPRKVWAYYIQSSPFTKWGVKSTYEIDEDEAVKFIKERGGEFAEDFSFEKEITGRRGELVASVRLREHDQWGNNQEWIVYKVYKGENGVAVFSTGHRLSMKKLPAGDLADFYRNYSKSHLGIEWENHRKEMKKNYSVFERDGEISKEILNALANLALLNDV